MEPVTWSTVLTPLGIGAITGAIVTGGVTLLRDVLDLRRKKRALAVGLSAEITQAKQAIADSLKQYDTLDFSNANTAKHFRTFGFIPWWFYERQSHEIGLLTETQARPVVTYYTLLFAIRRLLENSDQELIQQVAKEIKVRLKNIETPATNALKALGRP